MSDATCDLCGRAMEATADRCACGARVDWLRRAPAALRKKLGRGMLAAVVGTVTTACTTTACAAVCSSDCAISLDGGPVRDASCAAPDTGPDMDADISPIPDSGFGGDCGVDAYRAPDTGDGADADPDTGDAH